MGALDILVSGSGDQTQFHVLELNGSGMGGMTCLGLPACRAILDSAEAVAAALPPQEVILIPISGNDLPQSMSRSRLLYEKLLLADAVAAGVRRSQGRAAVDTLVRLESAGWRSDGPTVVLGHGQEVVRSMSRVDGMPSLAGRPVTAVFNDRLAMRVWKALGPFTGDFRVANECFQIVTDKGLTYGLLNEFLSQAHFPSVHPVTGFAHAHTHDELLTGVAQAVEAGRKVVIKPHATGRGDGIEFFLDGQMASDRIKRSLAEMEAYYAGGPMPYTITDFIDSRTIEAPGAAIHGRKFELRVVVYRDGDALQAYPSIVKICAFRYDPPTASATC